MALDRPFFLFPGRGAGLALLTLRVMSGVAAIAVGAAYADGWSIAWISRVVGVILVLDGLLLALGLFTRLAGIIAPALASAVAFHWLLPPSPWLIEIRAVAIPFAVICLSLVALGPGAYSIDARLFGRKQLRIPPRTPPEGTRART
jgi:uncharacterized membrane protein YphA (DoxX/SURF4 family)